MAGKLQAHRAGMLHRAVSVLAFTADGAWLLQRRAREKYHSGGLWSNTACTHPRQGESLLTAAERCLRHEMGLVATLRPAFAFMYRAQVAPDLVEHEYDHVFVAHGVGAPSPNDAEVEGWRRVPIDALVDEMECAPHTFTAWFPIALQLLREATLDRTSLSSRPDRTWFVPASYGAQPTA